MDPYGFDYFEAGAGKLSYSPRHLVYQCHANYPPDKTKFRIPFKLNHKKHAM